MFDISQRIVEDLNVLSEGAGAHFEKDALDGYRRVISRVSDFVSSDIPGSSLTPYEIARLVLDRSYNFANFTARPRAEMKALNDIHRVMSYYVELFKVFPQ